MPVDAVIAEVLRVLGPKSVAFVREIVQRHPQEMEELITDLRSRGIISREGETLRITTP